LKGDSLPATDTLGKHCQPKELEQGEDENGTVISIGVLGSAFIPDEDGLSMGWLEYYKGDRDSQLSQLIECLSAQRTVRKSHKLALIKIQNLIATGIRNHKNIEVKHDPLTGYESHSLITGYDSNDSELMEMIALEISSLNAMLA